MADSTKTKIKKQITAVLQGLVASNVLGAVVETDLQKNPFEQTYEKYPVALVGLSSTSSAYETNRENLRTYAIPILIIQRVENTTTPQDMEDLEESITNAFDNDPTLAGMANAGVEGAAVPTDPISSGDKSFIGLVISIKAKALVELTF